MQPQKFSISSRIKSFGYAFTGIRHFLVWEHNARIHLAATVGVVVAGFLWKVSSGEAATLAIVTGLVWVTEILNTCVERLADLFLKEHHPGIKIVKDLAAGAVLIAAIIAIAVALFIFIPKIV
jgi:diacylglycerol kinase